MTNLTMLALGSLLLMLLDKMTEYLTTRKPQSIMAANIVVVYIVGQPVLRLGTYRYVVMYLRKQDVGSYAVMYVCVYVGMYIQKAGEQKIPCASLQLVLSVMEIYF